MREVQSCAYYPFVQNKESTETEERIWKTGGEEEEEEPEFSQSWGDFFQQNLDRIPLPNTAIQVTKEKNPVLLISFSPF